MRLITLPRPKVFSTALPDSLELFVPSSHSSGLEDVSDLTRTRLGGAVLLVAPDVEICTDRSRLGNGEVVVPGSYLDVPPILRHLQVE